MWARPLTCASALLFLATSAGSAASKAKPTVTPGLPADPLQRLIVAVNTGDLAAVEGIAEEGKKAGAKGLPLRLLAGNGFFNLGEPQRALEEHRVALKDPAKGPEARLEVAIDLMVLRRFDEMCKAMRELASAGQGRAGLGSPAMYAYSLLRCGRPADGRELLQSIYRAGHSSAEEALTGIFGQLQRFQRYERDLLARTARVSADPAAKRALGELYLCGDYVNPWSPALHHRKAAKQFRAEGGADPERCELAGRIALAEILDAENRKREKLSAVDLASAEILLRPHLREPGCAEAAEAGYIYLKDARPKDQTERTRLLEVAISKFPAHRGLRDLLLDEYRNQSVEVAKRKFLEETARAFSDNPYPFLRLAMVEMIGPGRAAAAIPWLRKGLVARPDSMSLNFALALLLIGEKEYGQAVDPAARYLAGQLETTTYHHSWDKGMALLTSALSKRSPWIDAPEEETKELSQFISSGGPYDDFFQSGHGCFAPGVGVVLEPPGWFRPDLVRTGASPPPGEKVPG